MNICQFLDTNGDGTGTTNVNGNYSGAADDFYYQAPAGKIVELHRMIIGIEDTSGATATKYGNIAALSVGIDINIKEEDDDLILNLTPAKIKTNAWWGGYCYDVDLKTWGSGNELLVVRWTFSKSGKPIKLPAGSKLVVTVNDDLTGLINHNFLVQGIW